MRYRKLAVDSTDGYNACAKYDDYSNQKSVEDSSNYVDAAKEILVVAMYEQRYDAEVLSQARPDKGQE